MTQKATRPEEKTVAYDAFISYRHKPLDIAAAQTLHKLLEGFRLPGGLAKSAPGVTPPWTVFMDQWELVGNPDLNRVIREALQASPFLLVICSGSTPESEWVRWEVETFASEKGWERVLPILIEGTPKGSFPASLLARNPQAGVDYLDATSETQKGILRNLKREQAWFTGRMAGVEQEALLRAMRQTRMTRTVAAAAVVTAGLALFGYEAVQLSLAASANQQAAVEMAVQAKESKAAALASAEQAEASTTAAQTSKAEAEASKAEAETSKAQADESAAKAEESKRQADQSAAAADASKAQADQSRAAAEQNQETAVAEKANALAHQTLLEAEEENVRRAEKEFQENKLWAKLALYEAQLREGKPLLARTNAEALLADPMLGDAQQQAAQELMERAHAQLAGPLAPVYREDVQRVAAFSPDAKTLVLVGREGSRASFDAQSMQVLAETRNETGDTYKPAFSSDSKYISHTSWWDPDGRDVILYDARTLETVNPLPGAKERASGGEALSSFFVRDEQGEALYYGRYYNSVWRMTTDGAEELFREPFDEYAAMIPINADKFIFLRYPMSEEDHYRIEPIKKSVLYDRTTGEIEELGYLGWIEHETGVQISNDGKWMAVYARVNQNEDHVYYLFNRETGEMVWRDDSKDYPLIGFTQDSTRMFLGDSWHGVDFFELGTLNLESQPEPISRFDGLGLSGEWAEAMAMCLDDGAILFVTRNDRDERFVCLADTNGRIMTRIEAAGQRWFGSLVVSPDGRRAVTVFENETIVWALSE